MTKNEGFKSWYKKEYGERHLDLESSSIKFGVKCYLAGQASMQENDDLTAAYMCGSASKTDEIRKLKKDLEELTDKMLKMRELLRKVEHIVCNSCKYNDDGVGCQNNYTRKICFKIKEILSDE